MATKPKPERVIQAEVLLEASRQGCTVWRNNTGLAWQGKRTSLDGATITLPSGRKFRVKRGILLEDARPVRFGLCEGSSDVIGLKRVAVTPDMVGKKIAVFMALEVKAKRGPTTKKQLNFLRVIKNAGGIGKIVRSVEDLNGWKV